MAGPKRFGPGSKIEKAKDFKGSMKMLLKYMGAYKVGVLIVCIFAMLSTVFNVLGPKILGQATTVLYKGIIAKYSSTGGIDFKKIGTILLWLIGLYIISSLFSFVQGIIMANISQKLSKKLRTDISEKINRMPLSYFEKNSVGDVLSRITNDVDTLGNAFNQSITQLITSVCTIIGILVMMLTISPLMTLITVIILPVSGIMVGLVVKKSQKYFVAQQKLLGEIDGQIEETFAGMTVIKAFNREEKEIERFIKTNEKLYESAWKSQFISGLMMPIMDFVSNLGYAGVAISGAMLAARGTIEMGDIISFVQYVKRFTMPISQLSRVSNMFQSMAASSERIFEFLREEEESQMPVGSIDPKSITGAVEFEHVKFGYTEDKVIIKDFNCKIEPGQMVAIVGPTGAGKTTIVKLLMRYYDIDGGNILLDGNNIKGFNRSELRLGFGMVLQDTWLFKGTIKDNIRYGKLDATDDEVYAAAKAARLDKFIRSLPEGYDTELNESASNISQGQKQLLTIARAIIADNPILILDEATSSVDTRTEKLIQSAMANLMKGRTSFVIAHRLSTIKDADTILVMKDGDIVEQGNHNELLLKNGFYAELYNSQWANE